MKGTHKHTKASLKHFDDHRCLSQSEETKCSEHMVKMAPREFWISATRMDARQEEEGMERILYTIMND